MELATVERALEEAGLLARGAFHPQPDDHVPPLPDGRPARTVVLAGNAGDSLWMTFQVAAAETGGTLGLDEWSRRVLTGVASSLGAQACFPFDGPPYFPFQRWAQRAEAVFPSPIGPLIHTEYGLWHAYRGALSFAERLALPPPAMVKPPCVACASRACLSTCPVGALAEGRYDVARCVAHVVSEAGRDCLEQGCRARRACPIGADYHYPAPQARFHMEAFVKRARDVGDS